MKKFSVRIKAVLVAAAFVVSLSLASCTSFLKEASLSTATVEDNAVLPVVSGFFQSDSINEKLRDAFLPVANQMAQISDDSDGRIRVEYTMNEQKEGLFGSKYAVTMYLSDDRDSIELKTVNISGLNTVKALDKDDLEWLNSTDIAEGALLMKRLGMEFEPETLGENSTERNAAEVFVKLYESFIGEETDISQVSVDCEPLLEKAYLLGFVDFYGSSDYTFDDTVYLYRVSTFASKVLTSIERDAFGRQSDTVTGEEFVDILRALYNAMRVHEVDGAENNWSSYVAMKHYEPAPYFVEDEHMRVPELVLISDVTKEKLGSDSMEMIRQCVEDAGRYERYLWKEYDAESRQKALDKGVHVITLSDEQKKKFREAVSPLYEKYCGAYMDLVDKIEQMQ